MNKQVLVTVEVAITGRSAKAVRLDNRDRAIAWVPKSQCEILEKDLYGTYKVKLPEWLAKKEGFI